LSELYSLFDVWCWADDLFILKLSYSAHHFPRESENKAVGYSPPSCLVLFFADVDKNSTKNDKDSKLV